MKVKLVDATMLPLHPNLRHPRTSRRLRAIAKFSNGHFLYPIFGADGEEDGKEGEGKEGEG
ncbi:MAG: hypothetical protein ACRDQB_10135, partial [Thermocrispum sp.]